MDGDREREGAFDVVLDGDGDVDMALGEGHFALRPANDFERELVRGGGAEVGDGGGRKAHGADGVEGLLRTVEGHLGGADSGLAIEAIAIGERDLQRTDVDRHSAAGPRGEKQIVLTLNQFFPLSFL